MEEWWSGNQCRRLEAGVDFAKRLDVHWLALEGHAPGHIARNRLPAAKKFLFGWELSPSLDVLDPSHRS